MRVAILAAIILGILTAPAAGSSILEAARPNLPVLKAAISSQWPAAPRREALAGQVAQESRWKVKATLHTSRELGRGLTQMTVAYDAKGRERFNTYRDAMACRALRGWNWQADPYNVRYQLTYLVLRDRDEFGTWRKYFDSDLDRWAATLVAYNAGGGTVIQRRAVARKTPGVNPRAWFGNGLESVRMQYERRKLYGEDLGEMRNEYPRVILKKWAPQFKAEME